VSEKKRWRALAEKASDSKVFVGPIAAGEVVVANNRSTINTLAVEMEGREALIVRGISDLLSGKARADRKGSQEIAAKNAAAFTLCVLGQFVSPAKPASLPASQTDKHRARDLATLARVLPQLPTTVFDDFFNQAQIEILQHNALYFCDGFRAEVNAGHFHFFDPELKKTASWPLPTDLGKCSPWMTISHLCRAERRPDFLRHMRAEDIGAGKQPLRSSVKLSSSPRAPTEASLIT
jgi:hypothetical protein